MRSICSIHFIIYLFEFPNRGDVMHVSLLRFFWWWGSVSESQAQAWHSHLHSEVQGFFLMFYLIFFLRRPFQINALGFNGLKGVFKLTWSPQHLAGLSPCWWTSTRCLCHVSTEPLLPVQPQTLRLWINNSTRGEEMKESKKKKERKKERRKERKTDKIESVVRC